MRYFVIIGFQVSKCKRTLPLYTQKGQSVLHFCMLICWDYVKQNKYGSKCIDKVIQKKAENAVCTNKYGTNCIHCINLLLSCSILLSLDLKFQSAGPKIYVDVFSMNKAAHTYLFFASVYICTYCYLFAEGFTDYTLNKTILDPNVSLLPL